MWLGSRKMWNEPASLSLGPTEEEDKKPQNQSEAHYPDACELSTLHWVL